MRQSGPQASGPDFLECGQGFTFYFCVNIITKSIQISVYIRFITCKMVIILGHII